MPIISAPVSSGAIAVSSAVMGVAAYAICRAVAIQRPIAGAIGVVVGLVFYSLGILPVGLYIAVALAALGVTWKMRHGTSGAAAVAVQSQPTATQNQPAPTSTGDGVGQPPGGSLIGLALAIIFGFGAAILIGVFTTSSKPPEPPAVVPPATPVTPAPTAALAQEKTPKLIGPNTPENRLREAIKYRYGGDGVPKNYAQALPIFQELAGNLELDLETWTRATRSVADMLYDGEGIAKSPYLAVKYYRALVTRKAPGAFAAYRLGQMHEQGVGVPKDVVRAYCYYNVALSMPRLTNLVIYDDFVKTGGGEFGIELALDLAKTRSKALENTLTVDQVNRAQAGECLG